MAEYDGSIRIGTGIDIQGFDDDGKKLEAKARRLAENISGNSDVEIKVDSTTAKKELKEAFDDIEKEEKRIEELAKRAVERARGSQTATYVPEEPRYGAPISTPGYNQDAIKAIEEQTEKVDKIDEHWNQLRIDVEEYARSLKELQGQGKFFGDEDYDQLYLYWKNATDAVKAYQAELNKQTDSGQTKIAEQEAKATEKREAAQRRAEEQAERALQRENERIQRQAENEAKLAAKEAERQTKIQAEAEEEQRLDQIRVNATVSNQEIVDLLERRRQLISEIKDMEAAGVGLGYQQYEDANRELEEVNGKIKEYRKNLGSVPEKFNKMRKSANKAFTAVAQGTKKSSALLSNFTSRLKGIALSLLIFNWISKGFNAMISGMKKGFENFAGYSDSYAQNIQNMKNAMSTLGNQFAAAFAPIVQMVIPWLTQLVSAISTAMTYVAQFIAVLSGKSTFTKAKKVQDDYNKSLGGTAKAADKARGALAKFDDLDVLEKKEDTSGGGAGTEETGANMFEEVPVDTEVLSFWQRVQEVMKPVIEYARQLKDIFSQGFFDGLGDWEYRWESIKSSISSVKESLKNIFTDPAVLGASNSWAQSVAYTLGSIAGSISSIGLTIAENLFGGIEIFLDENKEQIKENLISMFDVIEDINYLIASFAESFAYVFEAFGGENGQQLTANLIEIFTNSFLELGVIVGELAGDILNIIIKPFIDNKEKFRTALDGFLGVLSEVTETIKQGIEDTFDKFNEMYDEHLKPFFNSIAEGLSDTAGKFFDFWNENVQPILEEWAEGFDVLWQEHIQPMLDKFIGLLGKVGDFLLAVWENILKPLIDWIIENVLPVILPIIKGIGDAIGTLFGLISDVVGGIFDIFGGLIDFVVGVFTGDWEKAWNGIVDVFKGIFNLIPTIIEGILNLAIDLINGLVDGINVVTGVVGIPEIPDIPKVKLPRLATGAVIRGGNPFMAILGDQPAGKTNIEAPLDTIKQAVREELSGIDFGSARSGQTKVVLNINGVDVGEAVLDDLFSVMSRRGYDVSVLGVT